MELGSGVVIALVVGFPLALFTMLSVLGWLEAWMVQPDERAAAVKRLLDQEDVESLEQAVADLMAQVAHDRRRDPQPRARRAMPRTVAGLTRNDGTVPARSGVS